eukprot:2823450-Amphidinium_carterae.1
MRRAYGINPVQTGGNHVVSGASPVCTADTFGKRYFPAASLSASMALGSSAFPFTAKVGSQIELDVDPSLPLF